MSRSRSPQSSRIAHIDGLRGVAILSVVLFHAYARWPGLVPTGDSLVVPPLAQGWVGVQLFFIISGFVIFMTLERSRTLIEFALLRWRRLFPAMLVATALIVLTAPLLPERPQGAVTAANAMVGLTFIGPSWWSLLRLDLTPIEGAFWSLFVEVEFYAVAGLAWFLLGRKAALWALAVLFVASQIAASPLLPPATPAHRLVLSVTDRLGAVYYAWFIGGALLYSYVRTSRRSLLWLAAGTLAVAVITQEPSGSWLAARIALAAAAALFVSALIWPALQRALCNPFWQMLGFVSYPLYLIHENAIVALTIQLGRALPWLPPALLPAAPIAVVVAIAWLIARFAEPALREIMPRPLPAAIARPA